MTSPRLLAGRPLRNESGGDCPKHALVGLAVALTVLAAACGSGEDYEASPALSASEARVRLLGGMGAAYLRIDNDGGAKERLVGAESPIAGSVSIHETLVEGGIARMQPRAGGFEIPAGGELVLEPGGKHLMLEGLKLEDPPEEVPLTLRFARHPPLEISAYVMGAAAGEPEPR